MCTANLLDGIKNKAVIIIAVIVIIISVAYGGGFNM